MGDGNQRWQDVGSGGRQAVITLRCKQGWPPAGPVVPRLAPVIPATVQFPSSNLSVWRQSSDLGSMTMTAVPAPALPHRWRPEWAVYTLVALVLALSTLAPMVRLANGGPRLTPGDLVSTVVSLAAWLPFVGALVWLQRQRARPTATLWAAHLALLLLAPPLHAAGFLILDALLRGVPAAAGLAGPGFPVVTGLGVLQYAIILATLQALQASGAADRSRAHAAEFALAREQLESQLARARSDAIRARLQPHFLFNTLNSISVMAAADAAGAQLMIRRLSELLRAVLVDDEHPTVPLRRELELVDAYLAIQRVRFGDRLRTTLDADPAVLDANVPTFLLQPLVENAIHHAVAARDEGGAVAITAGLVGDRMRLIVRDDGASAAPPGQQRDGLGLRNTRERLAQMYGPEARFEIEAPQGGGWEVRLELPVSRPPSPGSVGEVGR